MKSHLSRPLIALPALVLAACTSAPPVVHDTQAGQRDTPWQHPNAQVVEPSNVLYARDGSVIGGPGAGSVTIDDAQSNRNVGSDSGSRMYLLERFQETVEENEALQFEVQGLAAALDKSEAHVAQLEKELNALQAKFLELTETKQGLEEDNLALAEHLTTAQIRRLQAEKLLIEAKIDWQRVQRMTEGQMNTELRAEADAPRQESQATPQPQETEQ